MATEAQKAACRRYYAKTKDTFRCVLLRFNKLADRDVIERIDAQPSKVGYIRQLVRDDIKRGR